jgi:hypothetical protein
LFRIVGRRAGTRRQREQKREHDNPHGL